MSDSHAALVAEIARLRRLWEEARKLIAAALGAADEGRGGFLGLLDALIQLDALAVRAGE